MELSTEKLYVPNPKIDIANPKFDVMER